MDKLIVNRIGKTAEACMLTLDIIDFVSPDKTYCFNEDLHVHACTKSPCAQPQKKIAAPPTHAVLTGFWDTTEFILDSRINVLGGMGMLVLHNHQSVQIPVIMATVENLAFYQARLLSLGETFSFETKQELPLVEMQIGRDYVEHYLSLKHSGGGEYVEYHGEPHLWLPQQHDCGGHILLGKQVQEKFYFTGFRIPFGHAVYLSPYTLHSDAYLIGHYFVVYMVTEMYSTVVFRDEQKQLKRLEFV